MAAVPRFAAAPGKPPGLLERLGEMLREARALLADYAQLAVLDARRATLQLAWLLGSGLVVAVLAVSAWMAGLVALIAWMWGEGVPWPAALGVAAGINLAAAIALVAWMRRLVAELPFTALLRQLRGEPPHAP